MASEHIIKVACGLEGHDGDWVEFDTSEWGLADYRQMYYAAFPDCLRRWIEKATTDWHLTGENGIVPHPGKGALYQQWLSTYRALGSEGLRLAQWLGTAPLLALHERMENAKKSFAGGARDGAGSESPSAARDSDGAAG